MSEVFVRPYDKDIDFTFIISSWCNGAYYGSPTPVELPKKDFFRIISNEVFKNLKSSKVLVACLKDDYDALVGFCAISGSCLEWIYVKDLYRKQGIGSLLLKNQTIDDLNKSNITKLGLNLLETHPNFGKKENQDGSREDGQALEGIQGNDQGSSEDAGSSDRASG